MTAADTRAARPLAEHVDDILTCVHCGFCLPACPTYEVLGDENDSPRGRLYLMLAVAEGRIPASNRSFALHMDQCLGCRACEPVCPSGVRYGFLLERAREARSAAAGTLDRLSRLALNLIFSRPWLSRIVWALARALRATGLPRLLAGAGRTRGTPGRFRFAMAMLAASAPAAARIPRRGADTRPHRSGSGDPAGGPASPEPRPRVALLEGCVMAGLFPHVNRATERVLRAYGAETTRLPAGRCCGALHAHAGELDTARALARRLVDAFDESGADILLTNSAGCGAALKEYGEWLQGDAGYAERAGQLAGAARDVSEWLAERDRADGAARPLDARVGYDSPCHLLHAQRIDDAPLSLLRDLPGLDLVELPRADRCCGAAGIYGLTQRTLSEHLLQRKLLEAEEAGVSWVATGNPGCLMQIGAGAIAHRFPLRVVHPVELLDRAIDSESP